MAHRLAQGEIHALRQRPVQECQRIRLVVVRDRVTQRLHGSNHLCIARVALAVGMAFGGYEIQPYEVIYGPSFGHDRP